MNKISEIDSGIIALVGVAFAIICLLASDLSLDFKPDQFTASLGEGKSISITSIGAAERLCRSQASINYRDRNYRTDIDEHSSRFDERRDLFLVMLFVSIGSPLDYYEYRVHCRVRYKSNHVDYFKAVLENKRY